MKHLGHPSYIDLKDEDVVDRASALPENGVPPEVVKIIEGVEDPVDDKLQPQKAATPCDGKVAIEEAGRIFAAQRPRAIVAEGHRNPEAHQIEKAALAEMQEKLTPEASKSAPALEVLTGNQLVDQFQPHYFAVAFPFCFKYATARPDVRNTTQEIEGPPRRLHGNPDAPVVDVFKWAEAMVRRVESQFRRDWTFGFLLWNYLFRTMVNLQPNAYVYAVPDDDPTRGSRRTLTNEEIAEGAKEVMGTLHCGKYRDITGELKAIQGDFTKVRHAPTLSPAARKLLGNVEARARNIPGTHEVRKTMRHQTHANRICYGTAVFVTMSPSERDTTLMVRLARARQSDPGILADGSGNFQRRDRPALDVDYIRLSPEALAEASWTHRYQEWKIFGCRAFWDNFRHGLSLRNCPPTISAKPCWRGTRWRARKVSESWCFWHCGGSSACAFARAVQIARNPMIPAWMSLGATRRPWAEFLGGSTLSTGLWNARKAALCTFTCKSLCSASTSSGRSRNLCA